MARNGAGLSVGCRGSLRSALTGRPVTSLISAATSWRSRCQGGRQLVGAPEESVLGQGDRGSFGDVAVVDAGEPPAGGPRLRQHPGLQHAGPATGVVLEEEGGLQDGVLQPGVV